VFKIPLVIAECVHGNCLPRVVGDSAINICAFFLGRREGWEQVALFTKTQGGN